MNVFGTKDRLSFGIEESYRITALEVSELGYKGKLTPVWRIEGASLDGVYYGTHSEDFVTTVEPAPLGSGAYSVRSECRSIGGGGHCKREQRFAIVEPDGFAWKCGTVEACHSLVLSPLISAR